MWQVDFADYAMPVQYKDTPQGQSIIESVKQVCSCCHDPPPSPLPGEDPVQQE